jgi:hypothetical protein
MWFGVKSGNRSESPVGETLPDLAPAVRRDDLVGLLGGERSNEQIGKLPSSFLLITEVGRESYEVGDPDVDDLGVFADLPAAIDLEEMCFVHVFIVDQMWFIVKIFFDRTPDG